MRCFFLNHNLLFDCLCGYIEMYLGFMSFFFFWGGEGCCGSLLDIYVFGFFVFLVLKWLAWPAWPARKNHQEHPENQNDSNKTQKRTGEEPTHQDIRNKLQRNKQNLHKEVPRTPLNVQKALDVKTSFGYLWMVMSKKESI